MRCPYCKSPRTKVVDKRDSKNGEVTRRRRECLSCGRRFTTYEEVEQPDIMIVKKDGRREPYSKQKLRTGIIKACEKRPISMNTIDDIVKHVESRIRSAGKREITSRRIGTMVMQRLKKTDDVAYIRFASVYREFEDLKEFLNELIKLIGKKDGKAKSHKKGREDRKSGG